MRWCPNSVLSAALLLIAAPAVARPCVPQRVSLALPLPDATSAAELVTPPPGTPRRGVIVLFPGSDVADMDGAIEGSDHTIISRPMLQVADRLACAGFVSFRYNKRYVTGTISVDRAKFDRLNGADFAADGRAAVAFVTARAEARALPLGLLGWSEGSTVAMAVAASISAVRAVVLMAPVVDTPAHVAQAQYLRIGKPYLARFAVNGALDADAIARADAGPGGDLAHIFVRMFRGFRPGERINPLLDTNRDGRISFAEADPILASWYADGPNSGLGMASSARALPGVADAFATTTARILLLQGLNDSMIAPDAATAFARRADARARVTLIRYPGLGHSLGKAESPQNDLLSPVAAQPLDDLARWLVAVLAR